MENKIMETAKGIFSAKNLKRAGIVAVIGAVLAGGGAYWHYGQEAAAKIRVAEARTQMLRQQADKAGLALLSEDTVRTLVADAIGVDETAITYRKVELTDNRAKGMKHDDDKHKGDHRDGDHRDQKDKHERKARRGDQPMDARQTPQPAPEGAPAAAAPQQPLAAPAPDAAMPAPDAAMPAPDAAMPAPAAPGTASAAPAPSPALLQPVYRVKCYANNVKYELILDAQSGAVLYHEIDD
mgnify:FL=1